MTILVATDFSAPSQAAADVAAYLARRRGEALIIAHVVDGPLLPLPDTPDARGVHAEARRIAHAHSVKATGALLHDGNVGQRIAEEAERERASCVVVGAQGEGARAGIGSVAASVLRHTRAPVFVVRDAPRFRTAMERGNLRALVVLALDETNARVMDALALAAAGGDFAADVVHYQALPQALVARRESKKIGEREIREELAHKPTGLAIDAVMIREGGGELARDVAAVASERGADFVICGSHHRHGAQRALHPSVAEDIIRSAGVSVLVAGAPSARARDMASVEQLTP